ncbi:fumarylacetoacetate hydrolase family protein [Microbacterium luticocti]|uniref:fumarylacetoacetate hydrolase family protein n=1 Tax=Microbacterium luticocti TaxID=451764 RepID=UPI000419FDC0|nr:fumarylacetoacetate hydrolase family protein [Microbacterium luticocti]
MKYATFTIPSGVQTWGALAGDELRVLGPAGAGVAPSLRAAIEQGLLGSIPDDAPNVRVDEVDFDPTIPNPDKIICVGANYRDHQAEAGIKPTWPPLFTRFAESQIGHKVDARLPENTTMFDYEGELAVVIKKTGKHIPASEAWDHIVGVTPYNDFSVRDWQRHSTQWTAGKNFDATGAMGPYMVDIEDIEDIDAITLETRVNGEVRQSAVLGDLVFSIPEIIEYVSRFTTLRPGDVIVTGTPGGVGLFMDPPALLAVGDVVEVELGGIGLLCNTVAKADE